MCARHDEAQLGREVGQLSRRHAVHPRKFDADEADRGEAPQGGGEVDRGDVADRVQLDGNGRDFDASF